MAKISLDEVSVTTTSVQYNAIALSDGSKALIEDSTISTDGTDKFVGGLYTGVNNATGKTFISGASNDVITMNDYYGVGLQTRNQSFSVFDKKLVIYLFISHGMLS